MIFVILFSDSPPCRLSSKREGSGEDSLLATGRMYPGTRLPGIADPGVYALDPEHILPVSLEFIRLEYMDMSPAVLNQAQLAQGMHGP